MKKFVYILAVISIFFLSCEENFSPKGEFEQRYALTCIIRGDTALQVAAIYGNYNVEGYDPSVFDGNTAYDGADIRLWYQDTVYVFKDSVVSNPNLPDSNFRFYYLDNFKPEAPGEPMEIEAMLKNGKRLRASCVTPSKFSFDIRESSNTIPAVNTSSVNLLWQTEDRGNFFVARIKVKYFENVDGVNKERWTELPSRLITSGEDQIPIYPVPSKMFGVSFNRRAIDYALRNISENNPDKNAFTVSSKAVIEVLSLDENISRYYSSSLEDNNYTVRVNETDYSNVDGGFGVFGSLYKASMKITLLPDYIESFGYKVLFEN
ncbi:MAG: DUF4249 family protein [Melioribacteraceae bacterium]|nr:DUF4249 family protein [Melioribacteraceae bacterium]